MWSLPHLFCDQASPPLSVSWVSAERRSSLSANLSPPFTSTVCVQYKIFVPLHGFWSFSARVNEICKAYLQDEEPVRLVSQVSVCCPGFDLQSLRVISLLPIERLQQARCTDVHRLKGAQLQSENLAEFLVIINLINRVKNISHSFCLDAA